MEVYFFQGVLGGGGSLASFNRWKVRRNNVFSRCNRCMVGWDKDFPRCNRCKVGMDKDFLRCNRCKVGRDKDFHGVIDIRCMERYCFPWCNRYKVQGEILFSMVK